jgi:KEOPS complex subunit Pcc1
VVHDATLEFDYDIDQRAALLATSVQQEVGEIDGDRSRTTVARDGQTVVVRVEANDLVALRAALNTWQTLIGVGEAGATLGEDAATLGDDGTHNSP